MKKCTVCEGSGEIKATWHVASWVDPEDMLPGIKDGETTVTECFVCGGTGEVEDEVAEAWEEHRKDWCECGNPSEMTHYYKDGMHPKCWKHHYRCADCGKITQIG